LVRALWGGKGLAYLERGHGGKSRSRRKIYLKGEKWRVFAWEDLTTANTVVEAFAGEVSRPSLGGGKSWMVRTLRKWKPALEDRGKAHNPARHSTKKGEGRTAQGGAEKPGPALDRSG